MRLRYWQNKDAATLLNLYQSVEDLSRQMPRLTSLEDAQRHISENLLPAENRAVFALEDGGQVAGLVAVHFSARNDEGEWDRGWVFYWAAPAIRGTGAMKAAVRAVCDWALGEFAGEARKSFKAGSLDLSLLTEVKPPNLRRLELGYRTNNPASGAVAVAAGFTVEGVEREKFLYNGQTFDAVNAARLRGDKPQLLSAVHHIELWTTDFERSMPAWEWLLKTLGFTDFQIWPLGKSWQSLDGTYIVLEQSPDVNGSHKRTRAGLNHLALNCSNRQELDRMKSEATGNGWKELFADRYPHAGGAGHIALYLENMEGFEIEVVAP